MDKLDLNDLEYVTLPINTYSHEIRCPKCTGGLMVAVPNAERVFGETLDDSYVPHQCPNCGYEALIPLARAGLTYENANLDATRNHLRDECGHSGVIAMIWARTHNYGIGHKGDLPWGRDFPSDLAWFKEVTTHQTDALLVTGRTTYEGLPKLEGRKFAVLTTSVTEKTPIEGTDDFYYPDIPTLFADQPDTDLIVIGGGTCYAQWMPLADIIFETVIIANYPVDTFCPMLNPNRYDNLDSFLVRNCDNTGKDAIFNYWMARKVKGTMEEHLIRERWLFSIASKFNVDTSNA